MFNPLLEEPEAIIYWPSDMAWARSPTLLHPRDVAAVGLGCRNGRQGRIRRTRNGNSYPAPTKLLGLVDWKTAMDGYYQTKEPTKKMTMSSFISHPL